MNRCSVLDVNITRFENGQLSNWNVEYTTLDCYKKAKCNMMDGRNVPLDIVISTGKMIGEIGPREERAYRIKKNQQIQHEETHKKQTDGQNKKQQLLDNNNTRTNPKHQKTDCTRTTRVDFNAVSKTTIQTATENEQEPRPIPRKTKTNLTRVSTPLKGSSQETRTTMQRVKETAETQNYKQQQDPKEGLETTLTIKTGTKTSSSQQSILIAATVEEQEKEKQRKGEPRGRK
ncbi:hypothetical protein CHS0354_019946 [Potamilus streckersoni]|uniref:Uncharacterized protein n=1 Tax=Potamilus streckersoni TaxID=2493646 RepID=A0AAE0S0E0_9BIVA|nr:hypothetical protein CHS0354_019946 [Potamilus streckersoni]